MLSMAPVSSAGGSANYFAKDNYYSNEESAESSMWYGAGAEMLGLTPSEELQTDTPGNDERPVEDPSNLAAEEKAGIEPGLDEPDADEPGIDTPADGGHADAAEQLASEGPGDGAHAEEKQAGPEVLPQGASEAPPELVSDVAATDAALDVDASGRRGQNLPLGNPSGRVDPTTFENILNGKLPDGTQVGEPGKRRLGMDLTFSAPKSVSVLGLVGGDKRLIEANMKAVQSAMRFAEKHFAEGRVKEQGSAIPVRTGNLVYALFAHDTSRALDPQAHVHAVIANMTRMPNGDWRSLHSDELWKNNTVLGSVYNAALRENIEKLGYKVELAGKHGSFEIVGVPKNVREAFSQRREQILEKAAELGIATPEGMNKITRTTRDAKLNSPDHDVLHARWEQRIAELGYDPRLTIADAAQSLSGPRNTIEKGAAMIAALKNRFEAAAEVLRSPKDPLLDSRTATLGRSVDARTQIAVASAIRHLDQREAAMGIHQITKIALDQGLSGVTPETIAARVGQLIRSEQLVPGVSERADRQVTMVATREAIATEKTILANITAGRGTIKPVVAPSFAADVLQDVAGMQELNAGQLAAASSIVSSTDRIIAVQGIAGSGKSTMLGTAARVLENNGKNVLGLAFQNKMVGDLAEGAGIEAQTLASFLMPYDRMIAENDRAGLAAARKTMAGSVVVVDEASMVPNHQMALLTSLAHTLDLAKLVLVGDRKQLLSSDSGKSFEIAQSTAQTTVMDKNLRQRTDQLRAVAALTNRGRAGEALNMLGAAVISTTDRTGAAAALWLGLAPADREQTLILTSGRQARRELNTGIQEGLKAEGSLGTVGKTLTVVEQVDRTREDMRHARNYEPGLTLSLWGDEKSLGLKRGDYKIARFIKGGKVQLERDGKKTIIDPKRLSPSRREDRLTMTATKELTLHEGDKIRWTANDKARHLHNSAIGRVVAVDAKGVTIEAADKSVVRLNAGDPMLRRLDLAYAINMHMAQGVTTDKAIIVMGSQERMLANQRLFNVGVTRARDAITVVTDDKAKLACQLDKTPGDKLSALEVTGQLEANIALSTPPPAPPAAQAPTQAARSAPVQLTPADLSSLPIPPLPAAQPGLAPAAMAAAPVPLSPAAADKPAPAAAPTAAPATTPDRLKVHEVSVPKLEKNLGLEL